MNHQVNIICRNYNILMFSTHIFQNLLSKSIKSVRSNAEHADKINENDDVSLITMQICSIYLGISHQVHKIDQNGSICIFYLNISHQVNKISCNYGILMV